MSDAYVVVRAGERLVSIDNGRGAGNDFTPDAARVFAAEILAAADEAEGKITPIGIGSRFRVLAGEHAGREGTIVRRVLERPLWWALDIGDGQIIEASPADLAGPHMRRLPDAPTAADLAQEQDRAAVRALIETYPACCAEPEYGCEAAAGKRPNLATKYGPIWGGEWCDEHAPSVAVDKRTAGPLRALLARMATWPSAPAEPTKRRALLADGSKLESLLFHDCIILGAGLNAAGERLIISTTCDDDEAFRRIHTVVDEASYSAYRGGTLSFASILQAAPFYLVTTPFGEGEKTIAEMTWDDLTDDDRPAEDSFCPVHAQWTTSKSQ